MSERVNYLATKSTSYLICPQSWAIHLNVHRLAVKGNVLKILKHMKMSEIPSSLKFLVFLPFFISSFLLTTKEELTCWQLSEMNVERLS